MNTQEFNLLSKGRLLSGFKLCHKNADTHFKTAISAADKSYYGIANSHLILAVEECIKATYFLQKIFSPEKKINVGQIFFSHTEKHDAGWGSCKGIIEASEVFLNMTYEVGLKKIKDPKLKQKLMDDFREAKEFGKRLNTIKIKSWWRKANQNKNRGFYVDFKNGKWITPHNSISKRDYLNSYAIVGSFMMVNAVIFDFNLIS